MKCIVEYFFHFVSTFVYLDIRLTHIVEVTNLAIMLDVWYLCIWLYCIDLQIVTVLFWLILFGWHFVSSFVYYFEIFYNWFLFLFTRLLLTPLKHFPFADCVRHAMMMHLSLSVYWPNLDVNTCWLMTLYL